jgi:hypothetical protein
MQRVDTPQTFGVEIVLRTPEAEDLTEKLPGVRQGRLGGLPPHVDPRQAPSLEIARHEAQNITGTK